MAHLAPNEPLCKTSHPPWVMLALLWGLALATGGHLGSELLAEAERDRALADGSSVRVQGAALLAQLGSATGLSALRSVLVQQRSALYSVRRTFGGQQAPPEPVLAVKEQWVVEKEPSPPTPKRVMIVGASSIQFELGRSMEQHFEGFSGVQVLRWGRHSTGMARPDYFDWQDKASQMKADFAPDLVIGQFGGNDGQGLADAVTGKAVARMFTDEWDRVYGERLEAFARLFLDDGVPVVLLGMPVMADGFHQKKMDRINEVTQAAAKRAGAHYIDTAAMTADDEGKYITKAQVDGRMRIIRATDGTHLTRHGSELVAANVVEKILGWFAFEQVPAVPPPHPAELAPEPTPKPPPLPAELSGELEAQ